MTRDGQNTPSADLPMGGQKHTGVGDGAARSEYATYGQVLDAAGQFIPAANVGGTANAIELTPAPAVTALAAGLSYRFASKFVNTDAATIAVSGLTAVAIGKGGSTPLEAGDIPLGAVIYLVCDGVRFQMIMPAAPSSVDLYDDVGTENTVVADDDRFVQADVSTTGEENRWVSGENLRSFCLGSFTALSLQTQAEYEAIGTKVATQLYFNT